MANWKAELAQAEAAAWLKANAGWDAGMPAELAGLKEVSNAELARLQAVMAREVG